MATNIKDPKEFLAMTGKQLDDIFRNSPTGNIPRGKGDGTAIVASGTKISDEIAWLVHFLAWGGKVFDPDKGELTNLIGIGKLKHKHIVAKVYKGNSWFDGKECIVLDYSKTSLLAKKVRDEIREVVPGIYLGIVYYGKKKTIHFALKFPAKA